MKHTMQGQLMMEVGDSQSKISGAIHQIPYHATITQVVPETKNGITTVVIYWSKD